MLLVVTGLLIIAVVYAAFTAIVIVPQKDEYIIERFGKYSQTLSAGLNFIVPFIERVAYRVTLKEQVISVPPQEVISKDNAVLSVNAIAYIQVIDAEDAVYGVDSYHRAITSLCQTTLRSIIGTMDLDDALSNREKIKVQLKTDISKEISTWGLSVRNIEIMDVKPSDSMQAAMEAQATAERNRRALVTTAEGEKTAMITKAQGQLESSRLEGESVVVLAQANMRDAIVLEAEGLKEAAVKKAEAIKILAEAMGDNPVIDPAQFLIAHDYIKAMEEMAKSENAKIIALPADVMATIKNMFPNGNLKPN